MSAQKKKAAEKEEPDFDTRLGRLGRIVSELEEGGVGLEEALALYREGIEQLGSCKKTLETYREEVEELARAAETDLDGDAAEEEAG